jgi:hypothetical protein
MKPDHVDRRLVKGMHPFDYCTWRRLERIIAATEDLRMRHALGVVARRYREMARAEASRDVLAAPPLSVDSTLKGNLK